jgi:hypothetical protein
MKVCSTCKINKPLTEYHKRNNRPCGVKSKCKECYKKYPKKLKRREGYEREYDLFKMYGLTVASYNEILASQNNRCAICNRTAAESMAGRKKHLCVDHCHDTGQIRGLLCDPCNRAIGLLKEDISIIGNAINYLTKSKIKVA